MVTYPSSRKDIRLTAPMGCATFPASVGLWPSVSGSSAGGQLVLDGDDALNVPCGLDDVPVGLAGSPLAGQGHDAVVHGDLKVLPIYQEASQDHAGGHIAADLRPAGPLRRGPG